MTSVRVFFVGGLMSFRALFNWMSPWIFVPTILLGPITQILLFAYIGRAAGVGDDEYFIIGNALNYAAIPGMFAMTFTIGGERFAQTLGLVLAAQLLLGRYTGYRLTELSRFGDLAQRPEERAILPAPMKREATMGAVR